MLVLRSTGWLRSRLPLCSSLRILLRSSAAGAKHLVRSPRGLKKSSIISYQLKGGDWGGHGQEGQDNLRIRALIFRIKQASREKKMSKNE